MLRQVVNSSSLHSIGYDRATQTLEVEFRNGGIYQYEGVSVEIWNQLRHASSLGKFFQDQVRDHFPTTRVS